MIDVRALGGSLIVHLLGCAIIAVAGATTSVNKNPGSGGWEPGAPALRDFALLSDDLVTSGAVVTGWYTPSRARCGANGPVLLAPPADVAPRVDDGERTIICVTVDKHGRVTHARVARRGATPDADLAVLRAALRARFLPGKPGATGLQPAR